MALPGRFTFTYAMFRCSDEEGTVQYTLVCDFQQDCFDNSDESFCEHPLHTGFLCSNGQFVLQGQRCNEFSDCLDDSDEKGCYEELCAHCVEFTDGKRLPPLYINLDGSGYFTHHVITRSQPCPDSHYFCSSEPVNCLPIYTRCNEFSDCTDGEDEQDCEGVTCSGLYQCQASTVCLHGDHLCDGWGQCPQRDDELMCDVTCPEGCLCEGHSFLCLNPFLAEAFPQLRYLDATGSKMSLCVFTTNAYLVYLSLSSCSIANISLIRLPNLQYISFTNNYIASVKGVTVFKEIHGTLVVFMLPFNSALNPLLTLWSIVTQRRLQVAEQRLIHGLQSRLAQHTAQPSGRKTGTQ
ncbi:hypothetical protein ACOMHN_058612 [Nucella lapillus]